MCIDVGSGRKKHTNRDIPDDRALSVCQPQSGHTSGACSFESSATTRGYSILLLKHRHRTFRGDLGCAFSKTQPLIKV